MAGQTKKIKRMDNACSSLCHSHTHKHSPQSIREQRGEFPHGKYVFDHTAGAVVANIIMVMSVIKSPAARQSYFSFTFVSAERLLHMPESFIKYLAPQVFHLTENADGFVSISSQFLVCGWPSVERWYVYSFHEHFASVSMKKKQIRFIICSFNPEGQSQEEEKRKKTSFRWSNPRWWSTQFLLAFSVLFPACSVEMDGSVATEKQKPLGPKHYDINSVTNIRRFVICTEEADQINVQWTNTSA